MPKSSTAAIRNRHAARASHNIPWLFQPLLRKKVSLAKSRDSVLDRGSVSDSQRSDQNGAGLKTCPGGYDAPGDHDPGNPHARPEFQIGRASCRDRGEVEEGAG